AHHEERIAAVGDALQDLGLLAIPPFVADDAARRRRGARRQGGVTGRRVGRGEGVARLGEGLALGDHLAEALREERHALDEGPAGELIDDEEDDDARALGGGMRRRGPRAGSAEEEGQTEQATHAPSFSYPGRFRSRRRGGAPE